MDSYLFGLFVAMLGVFIVLFGLVLGIWQLAVVGLFAMVVGIPMSQP